MKKIYLFFVITFLYISSYAQSVSLSQATDAARMFFNSQEKSGCELAMVMTDDSWPVLYVFNADNGYVVISGDFRMPTVLAFGNNTLYSEEDVIEPVKMWLNYYSRQIDALHRQPSNASVSAQWQTVLARSGGFRTSRAVEPLMKSHWDQGEFYNYYCPRDKNGYNGRVVTGCVATAMAQLIYYFRFPQQGIGSYSYTDENYGVQSADYGAATYDYSAMCDEPTAINSEISKLIYHFGVGVDMHYGVDGSGMFNHSAARVLRTYFKYNPETEYLFRDSTDLNWDSVIVSHLERKIPMYYAGWDDPDISGHGFICDGYQLMDSNYYFHFNFGWSGSYDGYFYTDQMNFPGYHFNFAQELIVNAYPDTAHYDYPVTMPLTGEETMTSQAGSFGTCRPVVVASAANMDYTWKIVPEVDNVNSITLDFEYEVATGDTLFVWAPNNASLQMQAITADTGTLHLDWEVTSVFVRYVSDDVETGSGFWANYQTNVASFCRGTLIRTSSSGEIVDGSGESLYNPFSNCTFKIVTNSYSAISLHVVSLDLEEGHDFLHLYGTSVSDAQYITSLTGHLEDTTIVVEKNRVNLVFESDETINGQGFTIDYVAGFVGVEDRECGLSVYPNPATDNVLIQSDIPLVSVTLCDVTGRVLHRDLVNDSQCSLSVSDLPAGVYMLRVQTENGVTSRKLVKR